MAPISAIGLATDCATGLDSCVYIINKFKKLSKHQQKQKCLMLILILMYFLVSLLLNCLQN